MTAVERRAWRDVPEPAPSPPIRAIWIEALALAVACGGPVVRIFSINTAPRTILLTAVAVVSAVAMGRLRDAWWAARIGLAVAAGAVAAPVGGLAIAPWLAGSLVLSDWAVRGRPPLPTLPSPNDATLPAAVVFEALAAWRGRAPLATVAPIVLTAVALVVTWTGPVIGPPLARLATGIGRWAGRAASRVVFTVLGLPLVVLPWLAHRLVWVDPLASPAAPGTSWVPLVRRAERPDHPWATDTADVALPSWSRWRRAFSFPMLALVVVALVFLPGSIRSDPVPQFAAFAHDSWWPAYWREMSWILEGFDPTHHPRFLDIRGRFFTVTNGVRSSWTPPPCTCHRLTVWVYGGSTLFGLGQRFDHTITSDLARLAYQHGLVVDVVNRGVPGDLHWIEAQRFEWDAVVDPRPDLVLFYDGVNDLLGSLERNSQGRGADEGLIDSIAERNQLHTPLPSPGPGGAHFLAPPTGPVLGPRSLAHHAVNRYEASRKMSEDVGIAHDLPIMWFWQPSRFSRPEIPGEPRDRAVDEPISRRLYESAPTFLSKDVIDLTDSLSSSRAPMFYDDVHTNELGSRLVAAAIYDHIAPELERLSGSANR